MLAPLATLAFLATLWLVGILVAEMLVQNGGKIVAVLRGRSVLATAPSLRPIVMRVSQRSRASRALHAQPRLCANLRVAA
jgi:hypothetical protein